MTAGFRQGLFTHNFLALEAGAAGALVRAVAALVAAAPATAAAPLAALRVCIYVCVCLGFVVVFCI